MCRFLSALVMPTGDMRWHPMIDSHSMLVDYFGLRDDADPKVVQRFAKVELVPADDGSNITEPDKWTWRLDEATVPEWWAGVEDKARKTLVAIARRMLISEGEKRILADGCWIVCGKAHVRQIVGGRIWSVSGGGSVWSVSGGGRIWSVSGGGSVGSVSSGGSVGYVYGGVVYAAKTATVPDHVRKTLEGK